MNENKRRRIAEAAEARAVKRALKINSLAVAALRAASALTVLQDLLRAAGAGTSMFGAEHSRALAELTVTPASRASAQMTLFYAALNVVVEGWRAAPQAELTLVDPEIDALLARSDLVGALANYRNSMLHPNELNEPRQLRFSAVHSELTSWAQDLCEAFLRYFREWRSSVGFPVPPP